MCVCVRVCEYVCVCVSTCVCVRVYMHVCVWVPDSSRPYMGSSGTSGLLVKSDDVTGCNQEGSDVLYTAKPAVQLQVVHLDTPCTWVLW